MYNIRVELQDATTFFRTPLLPGPVLKHGGVSEAAEAHQATMYEDYASFSLSAWQRSTHRTGSRLLMTLQRNSSALAVTLGGGELSERGRTYPCLPGVKINTPRRMLVSFIILMVSFSSFKETKATCITQILSLSLSPKRWQHSLQTAMHVGEHFVYRHTHSKLRLELRRRGPRPFYMIPISADSVTAVRSGLHPGRETVIHAHIPAVSRLGHRWGKGIKPLNNRRVILWHS
jgi:hypothetical protein